MIDISHYFGRKNINRYLLSKVETSALSGFKASLIARGVLPDMGYIGMCRCGGYGFQAVYSWIGYINQRVWV